jgi:hypothetical protein
MDLNMIKGIFTCGLRFMVFTIASAETKNIIKRLTRASAVHVKKCAHNITLRSALKENF